MLTLTIIAALLTVVLLSGIFGVFFTYSNSVVPGLDAIDAERAVDAMRKINITIINPLFMATFIGPVITGAATGILLLTLDETTPALLFFGATAVYLIGSVMFTTIVNVPLNNALENSTSTDWAKRWADFSPKWRTWNTARAVFSMVSLVLCGIALYVWGD